MKPATLLIVVMAMFFFLIVLGGGGYFLTRKKDDDEEGQACEGSDKNGVYEYDADGNCIKVGCVKGYYSQNGVCIKRRDYSDESSSGETPVDCELDPNTPYNYGICTDLQGNQLTGDIGSCGKGKMYKTPNVVKGSIGTNASCPSGEYVECEVPCPKVCKAPDELWVSSDDSKCMAGTRVLGEPINGVTYCGEGVQMKILDESKIVTGTMDMDQYKDSINFSACTSPRLKPCKVECTSSMLSSECPIPSSDLGWVYEGGGTVYTKESAEKLLNGEIDTTQLVKLPSINRVYAINNNILKKDSTTGIWSTDTSKIPTGYKIKFKASSEYSTKWLRDNGCSIFTLEEAQAPRSDEAAKWKKNEGNCYEVGCGQFKKKNISWTLDEPAWGGGNNTSPPPSVEDCPSQSPSCCDEKYVGQWVPITGYEGCTTDGKRIYTRKGNGNLCSDSNRKEEVDSTCNYDCKLTGITLGPSVKLGYYRGYSGNIYGRYVTNEVTKAPKGTGRACGTLKKYFIYDTDMLNKRIDTEFGTNVELDPPPEYFSCGQNAVVWGVKKYRFGTNCDRDGNGVPEGYYKTCNSHNNELNNPNECVSDDACYISGGEKLESGFVTGWSCKTWPGIGNTTSRPCDERTTEVSCEVDSYCKWKIGNLKLNTNPALMRNGPPLVEYNTQKSCGPDNA